MDRVLDLLHRVKWEHDGRLTFRRSCAHGVCGSDAMMINGRNRLACKIRVDQLGAQDLGRAAAGHAGHQGPGRRHGRFLRQVPQRHAVPDGRRRCAGAGAPPVAEDRERYDDTTKCILCAACTSSCPSFWAPPSYVGPAAIVNAHRFIFDSRDDHADERLEILADKDGVWRCRTIFNCVDACPRGINITQAILEVSQAIVERQA